MKESNGLGKSYLRKNKANWSLSITTGIEPYMKTKSISKSSLKSMKTVREYNVKLLRFCLGKRIKFDKLSERSNTVIEIKPITWCPSTKESSPSTSTSTKSKGNNSKIETINTFWPNAQAGMKTKNIHIAESLKNMEN